MNDLPDSDNFYSTLHGAHSPERIAGFFGAEGWSLRKAGHAEWEVRAPFAELVIEAENPVLIHGGLADPPADARKVLRVLERHGIRYRAECYGADGALLAEPRWGDDEGADDG